MKADPEYAMRLNLLPLLVRKALKDGLWDIALEGNIFRREWFKRIVKAAPDGLKWARYYDLAASLRETASRTATGACALADDGTLYIRDMIADRMEWPDQEKLIKR